MAFEIKQDDTRPVYVVPLVENFGTTNDPIDLSTATSVQFFMRLQGDTGPPKVDAAAVVTDDVNGEVTYTWVAGDTDTVGTFEAEFQITWADGGIQTIPNNSYFEIAVIGDLGD